MTKDELKDLACLGFSADLVMQSFCHTAAYPKPVDVKTHATLPDFIMTRGGVSLRPGDGIIHSWLNRMLLPDTVGTGGDLNGRRTRWADRICPPFRVPSNAPSHSPDHCPSTSMSRSASYRAAQCVIAPSAYI